ncbi:hypothetical protein [Holospora undulata]|uniref:Uncharacterized protein n=1 Tax=Holospora undulata HU1 TaxID=1321371 RepID=A0A061JH98_9PROT|nr:hypothetical protein [Holospora undulata]ETZ05535.1 hypothetical protein K737_300021 [Holospora undulata HU1]
MKKKFIFLFFMIASSSYFSPAFSDNDSLKLFIERLKEFKKGKTLINAIKERDPKTFLDTLLHSTTEKIKFLEDVLEERENINYTFASRYFYKMHLRKLLVEQQFTQRELEKFFTLEDSSSVNSKTITIIGDSLNEVLVVLFPFLNTEKYQPINPGYCLGLAKYAVKYGYEETAKIAKLFVNEWSDEKIDENANSLCTFIQKIVKKQIGCNFSSPNEFSLSKKKFKEKFSIEVKNFSPGSQYLMPVANFIFNYLKTLRDNEKVDLPFEKTNTKEIADPFAKINTQEVVNPFAKINTQEVADPFAKINTQEIVNPFSKINALTSTQSFTPKGLIVGFVPIILGMRSIGHAISFLNVKEDCVALIDANCSLSEADIVFSLNPESIAEHLEQAIKRSYSSSSSFEISCETAL